MKNPINQRWWDVPAALFLLAALFSAAVRLNATNWTDHLGRMELVVVLGAIFGFALGKSIFSGRVTFLMGLVYTVFVIPWQLGLIMPVEGWQARLEYLYARLYWATADFLANNPVQDPILFLTTMMVLYWFAGLLSSYQLVRRANPWVPLLALGGMILVVEYTVELYHYARMGGAFYSFLFLLFTLLLMGRVYYLRSRKEWEERGGTVEMEVGYDLGRGVAFAAVVVALLAWNMPRVVNLFDTNNPAQERVSRSWQLFRDRVSKAVNSLQSPEPVTVEGYGSNLFLGTGGILTDELVFTVRPEFGRQSGRIYWSGRTFDQYINGEWQSTITETTRLGPGVSQMTYPSWSMRREVQFTFNSQVGLLRTLYYSAEPLNINREAQGVVSVADDGAVDFNAIIMDPPLRSGEEYMIRSAVSQPTIMALREAGEEYPEWIEDRYLQLPTNFSPRIADLARQIAGDEETPYDQAQAITQYLRRTITYSETVPEPPRNRDPIEWFLFDIRSGFCNYYASAEVLMLRSLGVPARLVAGYAEGTWDPEQNLYTVIGKDSHAWPEVYFPGLGWIPFEPTVSQPTPTFPLGERADNDSAATAPLAPQPTFDPFSMMGQQGLDEQFDFGVPQGENTSIFSNISPWTIVLFFTLLIVGVLVFLEWRRRRVQDLPFPSWMEKTMDERGIRTPTWLRIWSRRSLRSPMENMFLNVAFMLRVWGRKIDPSLTPAEQVAILVNVVPDVTSPAVILLEEYQRAMYSQYPGNSIRARTAVNDLRSIGYRTWAMRLIGLG
jgi:transglutaminase-like putative cysteine protease